MAYPYRIRIRHGYGFPCTYRGNRDCKYSSTSPFFRHSVVPPALMKMLSDYFVSRAETERWVDEVIPDAPWVINQEFIDKHNIDYVAHDALPYADTSGAANDVYEFVKAIGKFKETKRTEGISTSDIIMRILKDYNQYIMRNLTRGYSRKDLGVSYVKEKQLRVNMGFSKLREKVKEHQEKFHSAAKIAGSNPVEWMENADRWIVGFLEKFEEGCHMMETAIKDRIQEGLKRQSRSESNLSGGSGEDSDS